MIENTRHPYRAAGLLLVAFALFTNPAAAQEQPAEAPRIGSYEDLVGSLTRAGVTIERHDDQNMIRVASRIDGQPAWAEILWREDKGVCQVVQALGFRVPPEHVPAMESAIARINHVLSYPGFYFNHDRSLPYCQHVLVLRPQDGGIPERVMQQVVVQLQRNVDIFRPALQEVAAGTLKPDELLARLTEADTVAEASATLAPFVVEGADLKALSAKLRPQAGDYARVFNEPFATKAAVVYGGAWDAGQIVVAPKPGQTTVRVWKATTEQLKAGTGDADEFPGGYREVLEHLRSGVVWHRFKFTEPEEQLGMAYDGLVKIDDRWVIFPKPWRIAEAAP